MIIFVPDITVVTMLVLGDMLGVMIGGFTGIDSVAATQGNELEIIVLDVITVCINVPLSPCSLGYFHAGLERIFVRTETVCMPHCQMTA